MTKMLYICVPVLALILTAGCVTNDTGSIQSAPVSYTEGAGGMKQANYIHLTVHVLFRSVPKRGAVARFTDHLGRLLNDLNIIGAVTALGSQPERMIAKLEDGTRAHVAIPIRVPIVKDRNTSISINTDTIRESAREALKRAGVDTEVDGIYLKSLNLQVKSTVADESD